MLRKFVCAAAVVFMGMSFAMAEEFFGTITKVDGDKVTFKKGFGKKNADTPPEEKTLPVTKDVKITKGNFNKDTKKNEPGEAIKDGLKNEMFSKDKLGEKGVFATITTDADNKNITAITTGGGFGGGKKKAGN
jgi:hypothetical protein